MFGLANAPRYFTKLMDKVLGKLRKRGIVFYFFDDMYLYAETWEQLMENLVEVLRLLKQAGLTLNLKKCQFGIRLMEYIGYILGNEELRLGECKVRAIAKFSTLSEKHAVKRFIGLAEFFWQFIPKFAEIARPLTSLTKEDVEFVWGSEQESAFQ